MTCVLNDKRSATRSERIRVPISYVGPMKLDNVTVGLVCQDTRVAVGRVRRPYDGISWDGLEHGIPVRLINKPISAVLRCPRLSGVKLPSGRPNGLELSFLVRVAGQNAFEGIR